MARMTSLARTDAERLGDIMPSSGPDVPGNLCIALTHHELEKLGVDDDVEVGDMLHMRVMVQATSVHKDGSGTRIECAVIAGSIEDETTEGEGEESE